MKNFPACKILEVVYSFQNFPISTYEPVHDIGDIQSFRMNMIYISSSEAKNAYFMNGEAEINFFSLHEMK